MSKLLLAAWALSLASIVGSAEDFTSDRARGCASHASPAALSPLGGPFRAVLYFSPFFSGRKVVRMGFLASGLGLLEFLVEGTGRAGVTPNAVWSGAVLPLLLRRAGRGADAEGRSDIETGATLPLPSHVVEPLLATKLALLRLLGGSGRPDSARLSFRAVSKSTRSLH